MEIGPPVRRIVVRPQPIEEPKHAPEREHPEREHPEREHPVPTREPEKVPA